MKKLISVLIISIMCFALVACSQDTSQLFQNSESSTKETSNDESAMISESELQSEDGEVESDSLSVESSSQNAYIPVSKSVISKPSISYSYVPSGSRYNPFSDKTTSKSKQSNSKSASSQSQDVNYTYNNSQYASGSNEYSNYPISGSASNRPSNYSNSYYQSGSGSGSGNNSYYRSGSGSNRPSNKSTNSNHSNSYSSNKSSSSTNNPKVMNNLITFDNMFGSLANSSPINGNYEPFQINNCIYKTSAGKTAKDGSYVGHVFKCGVQLKKGGSLNDLNMSFIAEKTKSIEIYASCATTLFNYAAVTIERKDGLSKETIEVSKDVYSNQVSIEKGVEYVLYSTNKEASINVWGIAF